MSAVIGTRTIRLYIDYDKPGLDEARIKSMSMDADGLAIEWTALDIFNLEIHFRRDPGTLVTTPTPVYMPAGYSLLAKLAEKGLARGEAGVLTNLASASGFVETVVGSVGSETDIYYTAEMSLNTSEMIDAIEAIELGDKLDCVLQVIETTPSGTQRLSWQFGCGVFVEVYSGAQTPTPADPPYPDAADIVTKNVFSVELPTGASAGSVSGMSWAAVPEMIEGLQVEIPAGGDFILARVIHGTITATGFDYQLNAAPPASGYFLKGNPII